MAPTGSAPCIFFSLFLACACVLPSFAAPANILEQGDAAGSNVKISTGEPTAKSADVSDEGRLIILDQILDSVLHPFSFLGDDGPRDQNRRQSPAPVTHPDTVETSENHPEDVAGGPLVSPARSSGNRDSAGAPVDPGHEDLSSSFDPLAALTFDHEFALWAFDDSAPGNVLTWGNQELTSGLSAVDSQSEDALPNTIIPRYHGIHGPAWDLGFQTNLTSRESLASSGLSKFTTGDHVLYFSAGNRLTLPSGWAANLSFGLPVMKDLVEFQLDPEMRILTGISKSF